MLNISNIKLLEKIKSNILFDKIIITTPDVDFNKYYSPNYEENGEINLRHHDHKYEYTQEEFKNIKDYNKTLKVCHSTVGVAILNTSITIVFGFSILVLSKFIPTIYFGIFTGLAMLLAMISVLTLLPSLILMVKPFGK